MKYPANHPVWRIVENCSYMFFIILFLYLNASNFDKTEIKAIIEIGIGIVGTQQIKNILSRKASNE